MHVSFTTTPVETPEPSLAYRMGVEGCIRFRTMTSGIKLVYEDNEPELCPVWVAEKPRTAVIEVTEPDYEPDTRFRMIYA